MDIRKYSFTIVVIIIFTLIYFVFFQSKNSNGYVQINNSSTTLNNFFVTSNFGNISKTGFKTYDLELIKQVNLETFDN